jgi:hypothetical protein
MPSVRNGGPFVDRLGLRPRRGKLRSSLRRYRGRRLSFRPTLHRGADELPVLTSPALEEGSRAGPAFPTRDRGARRRHR